MKRGHRWLALGQAMLWSGITAACGGDTPGPSAASTSGAGGATVSVASSTSSGGGEGGGGGGSGGSGGSVGGGGHGGVGGDGGEAVACPELPPLPLVPEEVTRVFSGSEDFAFDGKGRIVAKRGPNLILFDATGQTVNFASLQGPVRGLRYRPDGFLVAARPELGAVVQISSTGDVTTYAINLAAPNGLYPDEAGNVWVTELAGDRIVRINPDASIDEIVSGAPFVSKPNGVVFDGARQALFYTNYAAGEIRRLDMAARGEPPVVVSEIEGAALDGLALDACGNLYVVDGPGMKLYRVRLDRRGDAAGDPELIASFPTGVESVQFGVGPGFAAESLYAIGEAGVFYEVKVGVAGAPIPTPP